MIAAPRRARAARMARTLASRIADTLIVALVVLFVTFAFVRLMGDPVSAALYAGGATPEQVTAVLEELGYKRPLLVQFAAYAAGVAQGDFGTSTQFGGSALGVVLSRVPATLHLTAVSLLFTAVAFMPLGFAAGRQARGRFDRALLGGTALALAVPPFVFGGCLILLFSVALRWLPTSGDAGWASVVLPAATLALQPIARLSRVLRGSMLDVASLDYVQLGRAKGLSRLLVDVRYVLRNALLPVISVFGLQVTGILGGAILVEAVFSWPGIGLLTQQALLSSDYNVVQCIVLLVTLGVLGVTMLTDIVYTLADPRVSPDGVSR